MRDTNSISGNLDTSSTNVYPVLVVLMSCIQLSKVGVHVYQVLNFTTSTTGNRASGIPRLQRSEGIQRKLASVFKVFITVQTKRHNC